MERAQNTNRPIGKNNRLAIEGIDLPAGTNKPTKKNNKAIEKSIDAHKYK